MVFCFKRSESVPKGVRRLGLERIDNALECLKDCGHAQVIHCARKEIKKARAVLRLVRSGIERKDFRRVIKRLRPAAKSLAGPRDAYVKVKTLKDLIRRSQGRLAPGALRHVRAKLRSAFEDEMVRFAKQRTAKAVERSLRRVAKRLERLDVRGKGWKALGPGITTAYADGRRGYQTAAKDSSAENLHAWRKRAKDLWYQVTLLRRVWPEQMDAVARELGMLGEYLGDDHDLAILRGAVEHHSPDKSSLRELETLNALIDERRRELQGGALALGKRFYAERPSVFCNRLAGYWQIWRGETKPTARLAETPP